MMLLADASVGQAAEAAPAPLSCLERHYDVHAVWKDNDWWGRLPDGRDVRYDDGQVKSLDQLLNHPTLRDMFVMPYVRGAVTKQPAENDDPGRVRVDALFATTFPMNRASVETLLFLGQKVRVHRRALAAFTAVEQRLQTLLRDRPDLRAHLLPLGGTIAKRNIAGTQRASAHSFGIAIDINPKRAVYWRWRRDNIGKPIPIDALPDQAIVDAFESEGFVWGGRWYHTDTMHFEYRPELLDPACQLNAKL